MIGVCVVDCMHESHGVLGTSERRYPLSAWCGVMLSYLPHGWRPLPMQIVLFCASLELGMPGG